MIIKKRILWVDLLKILSIYGVITIHSSAPLLITYDKNHFAWWVGNLYDSLSRWCIPVFFMLSGFFILEQAQRDSLRQFYQKRFNRIIIPFIMWSASYFLWRILVNKEQLGFCKIFRLFVEEPAYYHLWFIYTLIGLYLLAPFMSKYLQYAGKRELSTFILLWFIFGSLVPTAEDLFKFSAYLSIGTPGGVFYYSGYFILGYILKNIRINGWKQISFCALFLFTFIITAYGTYYLTVKSNGGNLIDTFYEYYNTNILFMSLAVFLIAKSIKLPDVHTHHEMSLKLIHAVAACVPGIYLIHAMVLSVFKGDLLPLMFSETTFNPVFSIPLFSLLIFTVSLCLVYFMKHIPGLSCCIP